MVMLPVMAAVGTDAHCKVTEPAAYALTFTRAFSFAAALAADTQKQMNDDGSTLARLGLSSAVSVTVFADHALAGIEIAAS